MFGMEGINYTVKTVRVCLLHPIGLAYKGTKSCICSAFLKNGHMRMPKLVSSENLGYCKMSCIGTE